MSLLYHLLSSSFSEAISEGHGPTDVSLLATSALHKEAAPGPHQFAALVPCSATQAAVPAQLKWLERGAGSQACCGSTEQLSSSRVPGWLDRLILKHPLPGTLCTPVRIGSTAFFHKDSTESWLSSSLACVLEKLK